MKLDSLSFYTVPCAALGFERYNVQDISRQIFDKTSQMYLESGIVIPTVFIIVDPMCIIVSVHDFMRDNRGKNTLRLLLDQIAKESAVQGIILAFNCFIRSATNQEKQTGIVDGTILVREYTDSKEGIIVQGEWHDASQYMIVTTVTKKQDESGTETVHMGEKSETTMFEGRFANLFLPTRSGYLN
jgi:hypothetical protein